MAPSLEISAIHEAGHATVALALGMDVEYVTIHPERYAVAWHTKHPHCVVANSGSDRANLVYHYGGIAAETATGWHAPNASHSGDVKGNEGCPGAIALHRRLGDMDVQAYLGLTQSLIVKHQTAFSQIVNELLGDGILHKPRLLEIWREHQ